MIAQVARAFPATPFIYYHYPMMTAVNFSCADVLKHAREASPNVVGAKFSDTNMLDMKRCLDLGMNML